MKTRSQEKFVKDYETRIRKYRDEYYHQIAKIGLTNNKLNSNDIFYYMLPFLCAALIIIVGNATVTSIIFGTFLVIIVNFGIYLYKKINHIEINNYAKEIRKLGYKSIADYEAALKEIITGDYGINNRLKACKIIQSFLKKTGNKGIIYLYCNLCYKIKSKNKGNNVNNVNNKDNIKYEYYELMEKAEMDWEKEINERRKTDKYYTQNELLDIIFQLISVLSALQKNHITHRDIKPQNILILKGKFKLCDFDEIRELEKDGLIVQRVRGSELYMSPILFNALRQGLQRVPHDTYKSDVFSLGMCLFYAACLSFDGPVEIREITDMNIKAQILNKYLASRYSQKLIRILYLMLMTEEADRPDFIMLQNAILKYGL